MPSDLIPVETNAVVSFNVVLILFAALNVSVRADERERIDFNRDVRPILSNHCFQCHGSDEQTREADLRLDERQAAIDYGAINPQEPAASLLLKRITSHDADEVMPPTDANKPLSQEQIKTLKQWIEQGAEYGEHWAFQRVERPKVPKTRTDLWCQNEIDAFVLRKLTEHNLKPSHQATREVLIRRLYQDLLGILPSLEEINQFVNDNSANAYQDLVDRVLASPHYGERWGRHWLDQARYADSNGYTIDGPRVMWPYRDWVIKALNDDMPFDQFTVEQLAGDLLPEPTKSQLVATAFHRNTMINQEGGVKADQYRNEALVDRVNTTGAVWLGLTIGCAQCHSHKFDPITHDEYYSLYAFFNDAADANNVGPTVDVYQAELLNWSEQKEKQLAELIEQRKKVAELKKQVKQTAELPNVEWNWTQPELADQLIKGEGNLAQLEDGSLLAQQPLDPREEYRLTYKLPGRSGQSTDVTAIRLSVIPDKSLPANGPGTAGNGNFVLTAFELFRNKEQQFFSRAWADHSQEKYAIAGAIDNDTKSGWAINVNAAHKKAGIKMNAEHEAVFLLAKPMKTDDQQFEIVLKHELNANYNIGRFKIELSTTPLPIDDDAAELKSALANAEIRVRKLESLLPGQGKPAKQMVIKKQAKIPETYRLVRGDFLDPDKENGPLEPTVPASLLTSESQKQFSSRTDLARWLISRDNPLTARVTMNRVWAKYFGRGLVETENDFGFQGALPTHPDLLDWLAVEFMENGWSLKKMHRLMVSSATYQQSSKYTAEHLREDPGNYLLARQSRFRVEAEIVRDQALAASGLLTPKLGGPSVYPPQPDGVYNFTQNKKSWPTEQGENRYRRTMYTMFYRSAPFPLLSTFDAPDFSTTCTRRVRSNTPLQSLTMANDIVFQECAVALAKRAVEEEVNVSPQQKMQLMFQLALTRQPESMELELLEKFYQRERDRFAANKEAATKFTQGQSEGEADVEVAALASVARAILNTDEFMTRN